jgi:hypothetical protein
MPTRTTHGTSQTPWPNVKEHDLVCLLAFGPDGQEVDQLN